MLRDVSRLLPLAFLTLAAMTGCSSLHGKVGSCDGDCQSCQVDGCDNCQNSDCDCHNGRGPRRYSQEWYAERADLPVGARQVCHKGKMWPPYPRPTEEQQPFWHKYHAAHYWPYPYVCDDRQYVRSVSDMQIQNGWMEFCTLYDYHFDPETHLLNDSGKLQLDWILHNGSSQHRTAFVQNTADPIVNEARLAAVREQSTLLVGVDNVPQIDLRYSTPYGRPAQEVDIVRRQERDTMPEPRVRYAPLPTGTGGGS